MGTIVAALMTSLVALSAVAMVVVGIMLAVPYVSTKHFSEVTTPCPVVGVQRFGRTSCTYTSDRQTYFSWYPCLLVTVSYIDVESGMFIAKSTLFAEPNDYRILKEDGERCSIYSCGRNEPGEVAEFQRKYGSLGQTFPCHPGPRLSDPEAILSVIPLWQVLLGLLLPASIFIFFLLYLVHWCICKCHTADK